MHYWLLSAQLLTFTIFIILVVIMPCDHPFSYEEVYNELLKNFNKQIFPELKKQNQSSSEDEDIDNKILSSLPNLFKDVTISDSRKI